MNRFDIFLCTVIVVVAFLCAEYACDSEPCTYDAAYFRITCTNATMDDYHAARDKYSKMTVKQVYMTQSTIGTIEPFMFDTAEKTWPRNIDRIYLNNNDIVDSDQLAFYCVDDRNFTVPISGIQILDLSNNQLSMVKNTYFKNIRGIQILNLSGNAIESIEPDSFNTTKEMQNLNLSGNKIKELQTFCFRNLTKLKYLDLSWNDRIDIQLGALQTLVNLKNLTLNNNDMVLRLGSFTNLTCLQNLNIASNRINVTYLFPLIKLELLDLDSNAQRVQDVERIPEYLPNLKQISMNNITDWHCDQLLEVSLKFRNNNLTQDLKAPQTILSDNVNGIKCDYYCEASLKC